MGEYRPTTWSRMGCVRRRPDLGPGVRGHLLRPPGCDLLPEPHDRAALEHTDPTGRCEFPESLGGLSRRRSRPDSIRWRCAQEYTLAAERNRHGAGLRHAEHAGGPME